MRDYKRELAIYLDAIKKREKHSIDEVIENIKHAKHVCVFGIGMISYPIISAVQNLTDIRIDFLCDNDDSKWGNIYHDNLRCISPDELKEYGDDVAILIATQHYKKIYEQLKNNGHHNVFVITEYRLLNREYLQNKENIEVIKQHANELIDLLSDEESKAVLITLIMNWFDFNISDVGYQDIFSKDEYFPASVIKLRDDESFVDVGAYNGDTLLDFIKKSNEEFDSIFAFELDKNNYNQMLATVHKLDKNLREKIKLYNYGLLDEEKDICYNTIGLGSGNTCINIIGHKNDIGKTFRLSDILKNDKVTFIKMDIEGSEPKALLGAEEIIKKQKPKLAICVYHKPEHLWEIPLYIKKIVPEYKIFLRHHNPLEYETVCYAII
jgi:FkbM family methyltransferase